LERLVDNVGAVDSQADRDRIAELVGRGGMRSPSFQVLAKRIALFGAGATPILFESALDERARIQLGLPWKSNRQLFEERVIRGLSRRARP
jgi:hypothetical protein